MALVCLIDIAALSEKTCKRWWFSVKNKKWPTPAQSWTPTMPKMKNTKKQSRRTLPSIGRVSNSSITKILMPFQKKCHVNDLLNIYIIHIGDILGQPNFTFETSFPTYWTPQFGRSRQKRVKNRKIRKYSEMVGATAVLMKNISLFAKITPNSDFWEIKKIFYTEKIEGQTV